MSDINLITLSGRLGKDPELKYLTSGTAVCTFSLASSEKWTSGDGEKKEKTEWNDIEVFGKFAEVVHRFTAKGKRVIVSGKSKTNSWEKDGQKHSKKVVSAKDVCFIDFKEEQASQNSDDWGDSQPSQNSYTAPPPPPVKNAQNQNMAQYPIDDDLPF